MKNVPICFALMIMFQCSTSPDSDSLGTCKIKTITRTRPSQSSPNVIRYDYTTGGDLSSIAYDDETYTVTLDADKNISKIERNGQIYSLVAFEYNSEGQVIGSNISPLGTTVYTKYTYTYNSKGQLTKSVKSILNEEADTAYYSYHGYQTYEYTDNSTNPSKVTKCNSVDMEGNCSSAFTYTTYEYADDEAANPLSLFFFFNNGGFSPSIESYMTKNPISKTETGSTTTYTYEYNDSGKLVTKQSSSTLEVFDFTYACE